MITENTIMLFITDNHVQIGRLRKPTLKEIDSLSIWLLEKNGIDNAVTIIWDKNESNLSTTVFEVLERITINCPDTWKAFNTEKELLSFLLTMK